MSMQLPRLCWPPRNDGANERRFILNGLWHANEILGHEAFTPGDWKVIGEYVFDGEGGRHQAFYSPVRDTVVMGELIRSHERIQVEQSLKYSAAETKRLWSRAGMTESAEWTHQNEYGEYWPVFCSVQSCLFPSQDSNLGQSFPFVASCVFPHVFLTRGTSRRGSEPSRQESSGHSHSLYDTGQVYLRVWACGALPGHHLQPS